MRHQDGHTAYPSPHPPRDPPPWERVADMQCCPSITVPHPTDVQAVLPDALPASTVQPVTRHSADDPVGMSTGTRPFSPFLVSLATVWPRLSSTDSPAAMQVPRRARCRSQDKEECRAQSATHAAVRSDCLSPTRACSSIACVACKGHSPFPLRLEASLLDAPCTCAHAHEAAVRSAILR